MSKFLISGMAVLTLLLGLSGWLLKEAYQDKAKAELSAQIASQTAKSWKGVVDDQKKELSRRNGILARIERERRDADAVARHFMEVFDNERKDPDCQAYLVTPLPVCAVRLLCFQGLLTKSTCQGLDGPMPATTYPARPQTDFGSVGKPTD